MVLRAGAAGVDGAMFLQNHSQGISAVHKSDVFTVLIPLYMTRKFLTGHSNWRIRDMSVFHVIENLPNLPHGWMGQG